MRHVLSCEDESDQWNALVLAEKLRADALPALPEIIRLLSDKGERIRGKAAETVVTFGSEARAARPALEALRNDKWEFVRDAANAALQRLDAAAP